MNLGLKNKVALITGASAGLGFSAALELAREGAQIAINSRSEENLKMAGEKIFKETGLRPIELVGNITDNNVPESVIEKTISKYGRLDILVSNAGGPPAGFFTDHNKETWKKAADLTLFSAINLARAAVREMSKNKWGRIIFITSIAVKQPIDNLIISNTLRAGLTGFAKSISNEFGKDGITINTVLPGFTDTERLRNLAEFKAGESGLTIDQIYENWSADTAVKRIGQPDELAALISFLASERAGFITGTSIPVDGGHYKGLL
ncbi:MAG: SDR family oxidoreductase [Candidatus Zixiibacteriota bacterium]